MNTQLIDKNNVEALLAFMGNEVFIPNDIVYYDTISFQGGNKFRYLNLFDYEGENAVPQYFVDSFDSFIELVKKPNKVMDMDGLAVVNLHHFPGISFPNIIDKMQPVFVALWGVDPHKFSLEIAEFGGIKVGNLRIIRLPDPTDILKNEQYKAKCSGLILNLFNIK